MLSRCFSNFSVGLGAFVMGLSQISSFFSVKLANYHELFFCGFRGFCHGTESDLFLFLCKVGKLSRTVWINLNNEK